MGPLAERKLLCTLPESRAIQTPAVLAMFKRSLGEFEGNPEERIEIEQPDPGALYATGADWARKSDWTIIITYRIDVRPMRLVAFERCGRMPWPVMVKKYDDRLSKYPSTIHGDNGLIYVRAAHDGTGIGDVVDGYLQSDADNVIMVGRRRSDLLSEYISAVEHGDIEAPFIRYMEGEHRYASVDDVYGSGHLPDTISAGALAWWTLNHPLVLTTGELVIYDERVNISDY